MSRWRETQLGVEFGLRTAAFVEEYLPSPFVFAILLTYAVFAIGIVVEGAGAFEMMEFWFDGFWGLLDFAMQMTLILLTGFVIAYHPRVYGVLKRLAEIPTTGPNAVVVVAAFAMVMSWLHWGLGLILGAIFAREMGRVAHRKNIDVHYPLLCVAGYMGLGLTWHWGLSASAPRILAASAEDNEFVQSGHIEEPVPLADVVFSGYTLLLLFSSMAFALVVLYLLAPKGQDAEDITEYVSEGALTTSVVPDERDSPVRPLGGTSGGEQSFGARIDNSRLVGLLIGIPAAFLVLTRLFARGPGALTPNFVNFLLLFAGILLYLRPAVYRQRFGEAAGAATGIILLFPFFAGIQGMMEASGISETFADTLLEVSTPETFPVVAWFVGAVLNVFIPSGGGQFAVIGPSLVEAANGLGVPIEQATAAYAAGDAHTNLLNPFWALPLLGITGIRAHQMFGYAIAVMLLMTPFFTVILFVLPV